MYFDSLKECLKVELKRSDETFINKWLAACQDPSPSEEGESASGRSDYLNGQVGEKVLLKRGSPAPWRRVGCRVTTWGR
jgi:hypothetical protein